MADASHSWLLEFIRVTWDGAESFNFIHPSIHGFMQSCHRAQKCHRYCRLQVKVCQDRLTGWEMAEPWPPPISRPFFAARCGWEGGGKRGKEGNLYHLSEFTQEETKFFQSHPRQASLVLLIHQNFCFSLCDTFPAKH